VVRDLQQEAIDTLAMRVGHLTQLLAGVRIQRNLLRVALEDIANDSRDSWSVSKAKEALEKAKKVEECSP